MINLRYHIVSITAVFLALAIGLALGSTLIQRGIVAGLEGRLDELEDHLDRTDGENAALRGELSEIDARSNLLTDQRHELLGGHLEDQPVLLLSVQGTDDDLLTEVRQSLRSSGAFVSGTLTFTTRWEDLSDEEVDELSGLFDRNLRSEQVTRTLAMRRVAEELRIAGGPPPEPEEPEETEEPTDPADAAEVDPTTEVPADTEASVDPAQATPRAGDDPADITPVQEDVPPDTVVPEPPAAPPVPEADLIAQLVALGYLEFFPESAGAPLPRFDTRYVLVADDEASMPIDVVAIPLLEALAMPNGNLAPIVVAGELAPAPDPGDLDADEEDPARRLPTLVLAIRNDEQLQSEISTVDSLDEFIGHAALVLALAGIDDGVVGHYGMGADSGSLLPLRAS